MGADGFVKTTRERDPAVGLDAITAELSAGCYDWPDPGLKPGFVQVWDKPVPEVAVDWMVGWTTQHPPAGVDPDDKWGPWMAFPLESGGWCFFGWVNT